MITKRFKTVSQVDNKGMSIDLKNLNFYKTGGTCASVYSPSDYQELIKCYVDINQNSMPYFVIGGGSNLIIGDDRWDGAVITLDKLKNFEKKDDHTIICDAGVSNSTLVSYCYRNSFSSTSWMHGLPGNIGGSIRMNSRCYGGEISKIVKTVTSVDAAGNIIDRNAEEVFKGYKKSIFSANKEIIIKAEITLKKGDPKAIKDHMDFCMKDRVTAEQFKWPNCGCVFKNDETLGISAGLMLDFVGTKNLKHNNAEVSPYHANFIFNKGCCTRDILELSFKMRDMVYKSLGVWLEYEVVLYGNYADDLRSSYYEKRTANYNHELLEELKKCAIQKPNHYPL